ncbi:tryptophan 7-halogenase [Brevundimonas sp.]|uniref:tryptophan 7-halogenase n=1 Tax=Brevundimonas sp. TaxID=1871086 RepID=UPI00391A7C81
MSDRGPTEAVIVGDGPAAWIMALAISRGAPARVTVITHSSPGDVDPFGPALTAPPAIRGQHARLGLPPPEAMACAVPVMGFSLEGPNGGGFVPFGQTGADMGPVAFHQQLARLGRLDALAEHSLAAQAARLGRFSPPSPDPASFLSTLDHGASFEAQPYAALLRNRAEASGASVRAGAVTGARRSTDGRVEAVELEDGSSVRGDLFIDASGAQGVLTDAPFQPWTSLFRLDRAEITVSQAPSSVHVSLESEAAMLHRTAPLPGRRVETRLTQGGAGTPFIPGRRESFWERNVIAVGAAAHVSPPLGAGALHLIHRAAERLIALWPASSEGLLEAREFNRLMTAEAEADRDFALVLTRPPGVALPDPAAHRLALFEGRSRISRREHEAFTAGFIAAALLASGLKPRRHDPLADALDPAMLAARADRIRHMAAATAAALPIFESSGA